MTDPILKEENDKVSSKGRKFISNIISVLSRVGNSFERLEEIKQKKTKVRSQSKGQR